ncbi:MAG TPA: AbiV family abortive infection protein [Acidobacteriaceae bacterium]
MNMKPKSEVLKNSIDITTSNGKLLLEDAKFLFDFDRFSTALSLAVLAQEEFAKAFLLQLVEDDALPWLPEVQRTMARHQCKHLLAIVMEWLPSIDWDTFLEKHRERAERHRLTMEWIQRRSDRYKQGDFSSHPEDPEPTDPDIPFPPDVADGLNIFRHEEVERFRRNGSPWTDPEWAAGKARKVADGFLDRRKQSALYVDISKTGQVGLCPGLITRAEASAEMQRAERLAEAPDIFSDEYTKLKDILPLVFENLIDKE